MLEKLKGAVRLASQLATIVIALVLTYAVAQNRAVTQTAPPPQQPAKYAEPAPFVPVRAGSRLALPGVDWAKNERTVLIALSQGCYFCTASAPFYQRVARELSARKGVGLMAVFPQAEEAARGYLKGLDVAIDDVRQLPLDSLGVLGTPTLIVVNREGVVTNAWRGQLPSEKEEEVLSYLKCGAAGGCG